jgi:Proprotein convertase P-domain
LQDERRTSRQNQRDTEQEGMETAIEVNKFLQRGNQKIPICKLADRFTVHLIDPSPDPVSQLAQYFNARSLCWINLEWLESVQLVLIWVEPDQLERMMQLLRGDAATAFVSHSYALVSDPDAVFYLTDQITLQFAAGTDANQMQAIATAAGLQVLKLVSGVAKTFVFQVMPSAIANPLKLANQLIDLPEIGLAEPNIAVPIHAEPADPAATRRRPAPEPETIAAWQLVQGDRAVAIAVVNSQLDLNHPAFWGEGKIVAPYQPHHFQVATAVLLPTEIAPNCALMPICPDRYLDDQEIEQLCDWITAQGADVVYWDLQAQGGFSLSLRQRMAIAKAATQGREGRGCVMVADACQPDTSSALALEMIHPDVINVASVLLERADRPAGISLVATGEKAGAIAAGVAALVLSVNPELTAIEVRQLLQTTADKVQLKEDTAGYDAIGYSQQFGYGKVNAFKAVDAARRQRIRLPLVTAWLEFRQPTAIAIPEDRPAISSIQITDERQVLDLEVSLELNHAFMGDLEIWLRSPNGSAVLLQNRGLGRLESLNKTYDLESVPLLRQAIAQSAAGAWQLQLIDHAPAHLGKLENWILRLGV